MGSLNTDKKMHYHSYPSPTLCVVGRLPSFLRLIETFHFPLSHQIEYDGVHGIQAADNVHQRNDA